MEKRIKALQNYMIEHQIEGFIISSEANRMYLSGFTGSSAMLLITTKDQPMIITDFRYLEQVANQCPLFQCMDQKQNSTLEAVLQCVKQKGLAAIAFEAEHVSYSMYEVLQKVEGIRWIPTKGVVERFRQIKDEAELEKLEKAESIGDLAYRHILPYIKDHWRQGLTENEIALEIERVMRQNGASATSFNTIVAAGAKSSLPHAVPGDVKLKDGDFVVMDFGCIYEGYCSDMTRTVVIGSASKQHQTIYHTVLEAQKLALEGIRSGLKGKEIDALAREHITKAGYGDHFGHGLGHSVGIEIHENPRFSKMEEQVIESGMVITVEPGIYISGFGGVRIEDMIVVTKYGIRNLTHSPKDLIIID